MEWVQRQMHEDRLMRAAEVFWREGYTGANTRFLAGASSGSVPSMYRHFASKLELARQVVALADRLLWGCLGDIRIDYESGGKLIERTPAEELADAWRDAIAFAFTYPALFGFAFAHARHPGGDDGRVDVGRPNRVFEYLAEVLERGRAAGDLRELPEGIALALFWGALLGFVQLWQSRGARPDEDCTQHAFEAMRRALAADPPASLAMAG